MVKIGFLIFSDVEELDFVGAFEVLSYVNKIRAGSTEILIVAPSVDVVRCFNGLRVLPDVSIENCPPLDVLIIPGGKGRLKSSKDAQIISFVKRQATCARFLASVCTGAFFLAEAGLLAGRRATTYHAAFEELKSFGAHVEKAKVVRDGNIFTGAGVSSSLELSLALLAALFDKETAQAVADRIEYGIDINNVI